MGFYVHLSVVFACDENDGVAALAARHRAALPDSAPREAGWFLDDLAKRVGTNAGPKGGLSTWGIVGNYTSADEFVDALRPFWSELLRGVPGGPFDFEHVIVFSEPEQSEHAVAHEISAEDGAPLSVTRHELPFKWGQM